MKLAHCIRIGIFSLIVLNLLMAFASIWIFARMSPAIDLIIARNVVSLRAARQMLAALVPTGSPDSSPENRQLAFTKALNSAREHITEEGEAAMIAKVESHYRKAFEGQSSDINATIKAIDELCTINLKAMAQADSDARQLGSSGAWGIVFMASCVFFVGLLVARFLTRRLILPLEEAYGVLESNRQGDRFRRCTIAKGTDEMQRLFADINEVLDQCRTK